MPVRELSKALAGVGKRLSGGVVGSTLRDAGRAIRQQGGLMGPGRGVNPGTLSSQLARARTTARSTGGRMMSRFGRPPRTGGTGGIPTYRRPPMGNRPTYGPPVPNRPIYGPPDPRPRYGPPDPRPMYGPPAPTPGSSSGGRGRMARAGSFMWRHKAGTAGGIGAAAGIGGLVRNQGPGATGNGYRPAGSSSGGGGGGGGF